MEVFNNLVKQFAELRASQFAQLATVGETWKELTEVNARFVLLRDEWLTLPDIDQGTNSDRYLQAQQDFHAVASTLIEGLMPEPTIRFGELPASIETTTTAHTPAVIFKAAAAVAPTTVVTTQSIEASLMATASAAAQAESMLQNQLVEPKPTDEHVEETMPLEGEEQASTGQNEPLLIRDLATTTYRQQVELLKPVFDIKPLAKINERIIDNTIHAISTVVTSADSQRIKISQTVKRAMMQHITSALDDVSTVAWGHRIRDFEPTFNTLVDFLINRKSDVDVQTGISAMSTAFNIPKKSNQAPVSKKSHKKSGARATTPPPGQSNMFKRPKQGPGAICPLCKGNHTLRLCPRFIAYSMEDREIEVVRLKLCKNCFSKTHPNSMCLDGNCKNCRGKHNSMLQHR